MKERLTKRVGGGVQYSNGEYTITCYPKNDNLNPVDKMAVKLCELEDKIENGTLIELPCAVGDSCYPLWHSRSKPIVERKISRITFSARNIIIGYYENDGQYRPPLRTRILGEDIFLTKEEAEKALERSEGK